MIDKELKQAARELRGVVDEITPPSYHRPRPQYRMLQAAAAIVLAVSAGASLFFITRPPPEVTASREDNDVQATVVEVPSGRPVGKTGSEPIVVSELDRPTPGSPVEDVEFATSIEAVTSSEESGTVQIPLQVRPAWNSDGTYFIVYEAGEVDSGHVLYDSQTKERLQVLDVAPVDIEQVYWHPSNPNLMYYVGGLNLIEVEVGSSEVTVIHRFAGCQSVDGADSRRISHETLELGQLCTAANGDQELVSINVETGEERRWADAGFGAPQPTPSSGRYVARNEEGLVRVFDQNGTSTGVEFLLGNDSYVVLETADGRDLLVAVVFSQPEDAIGSVVAFDLATGSPTVVVGPSMGYPYPPSGHEFGVSVANDGRIVFATAASDRGEDPEVLEAELVLVDFDDPTPVARRLGHHRNTGDLEPWGVVYPSLHPTLSKVLFGSDWGGSAVNSYIVGG